jgi:hypothetical protein
MMNYGVANEMARRKEDDSATGQGQGMGVVGLLRNPRNRLYLATLVAATPFLVSFAFYVSQFSFHGQFIIGVYMLYTLHRNYQRKRKVLEMGIN